MGSSGGERFAGHGLPDSDRARLRAICWYLTLGGCHVAVFATDESSFNYRCEGCNAQPYRAGGRLQAFLALISTLRNVVRHVASITETQPRSHAK
jgi:hypothetical protein